VSERSVLVTEHTPRLDSGHGLRRYAIARALASEHPLDIVYTVFGAPEPAPEYSADERFRLHPVHASRGARRLVTYLRALASGIPRGFARGVSPELVAAAQVASRDAHKVVADGPVAAAAVVLGRIRPFIYNGHNVESDLRARIGDRGIGPARLLRRFEMRLLSAASESWMVSERDMKLAAELCPDARLRLVPNAVDVAAIEAVAPDPGAQLAVFVGSLDYAPNRRAIRFLVDDVMPLVWERLPNARLRVAGRGVGERIEPSERVEALGFVEHIRDAYVGASCVVIPLLEGGGSPLKFVEALAYGLPVVATPFAAAGLSVEPGRDFTQVDGTPEAFAAELTAVLRGERPGVGHEGRELVARSYSVEAVARAVGPRGS
jgi:glycosyltransferase involved in cell wall biosynthesis